MADDKLSARIEGIFEVEPDEDGSFPREVPHETLTEVYGFDFAYLGGVYWEGSTSHRSTRICPEDDRGVSTLLKTDDVPTKLFEAALRLYGDSLLHYVDEKEPATALRFYPPIILTFWSAFEAFVRRLSELMVLTCKNVPPAIADYLREIEPRIDRKGNVDNRAKFSPVLDRYSTMLRYGFGLDIDRGSKFWQRLEGAKELRDYYTHIEAMDSRSLSDSQLLEFLESTLLGIIWPSVLVKRSLLLDSLRLHYAWAELKELTDEYLPSGHKEEPFFHKWDFEKKNLLFYCPFTNVNQERFRTYGEEIEIDAPDEAAERDVESP
jgi:hypothetical protein